MFTWTSNKDAQKLYEMSLKVGEVSFGMQRAGVEIPAEHPAYAEIRQAAEGVEVGKFDSLNDICQNARAAVEAAMRRLGIIA